MATNKKKKAVTVKVENVDTFQLRLDSLIREADEQEKDINTFQVDLDTREDDLKDMREELNQIADLISKVDIRLYEVESNL